MKERAQVSSKEGTDAILYECSMVVRVHLTEVKAKKSGVSARLRVLETLPTGLEEQLRPFDNDDLPGTPLFLNIHLSWAGIHPDVWEIPEVGMRLFFDPALVKATIDYCHQLPPEAPIPDRSLQTNRFLQEQFAKALTSPSALDTPTPPHPRSLSRKTKADPRQQDLL